MLGIELIFSAWNAYNLSSSYCPSLHPYFLISQSLCWAESFCYCGVKSDPIWGGLQLRQLEMSVGERVVDKRSLKTKSPLACLTSKLNIPWVGFSDPPADSLGCPEANSSEVQLGINMETWLVSEFFCLQVAKAGKGWLVCSGGRWAGGGNRPKGKINRSFCCVWRGQDWLVFYRLLENQSLSLGQVLYSCPQGRVWALVCLLM